MPKSHYIDELTKELKKKLIDAASELSVDYTFSRYPDVSDNVPYEEYDKNCQRESENS